MANALNLVGSKFGRLTVIEKESSGNGKVNWKCQCECGNETSTITSSLTRGVTKSCGCIKREMDAKRAAESEARKIVFNCDYCKEKATTPARDYKRKEKHFCSTACYADYRKYILPKEEQPRFGTGEQDREFIKRKIKARSIMNHAIRGGSLDRKNCQECGNPKSEGHHSDYDKPLEVIWLCRKHHAELHKKLRRKNGMEVSK